MRTPRIHGILLAIALLAASGAASAFAQDASKYRLKPGAAGKLCLECHADFQETLALGHVHSPVRSGSCADCHDPHASEHGKLLQADPAAICVQCHADVAPEGAASVHRMVVEGGCVDCHDPHASEFPNQLRASGNALCGSCHEDVVGHAESAAHAHVPARGDCLGCHDPHASATAPALLARAVPALCVECHDPTRPQFAKDHMDYPVQDSDCSSCHDPHGSKHKGLLWASVHEPVQRRMCSQCHAAADSGQPARVRLSGPDLCRGCHTELYNETFARNRIHWPIADRNACANCHEPHASRTARLLSAPVSELCTSCHRDVTRRQARATVPHEPVVSGDCTTCHAPHASDTKHLLAAASDFELCGGCHDWKQHSMHPIGNAVVDQRNRNLTLDCLSCHQTHGSENEHLTYFEPKRTLCVQCHAGFAR